MHLCPRQCHYESERCVTLRELWQQGERAQLGMKNGRETMGLVVKFFTYFRALSLKQSTQDPNLVNPCCILLIMTASFFFGLFCSCEMEWALEPRHHQDISLCLSPCSLRNAIEGDEECSQCTHLLAAISLG